ncbi:MAG: group 1 truncated hemoglobin [Bacteroidota bacterium]
MKKLTIVALLFITLASFAQQQNQTSLFIRLGGTEGITSIVDDVVATHMENPNIKAVFLPYNEEPKRLALIKKHTVEFFSAGGGGPIDYTGKSMPNAHRGMNISPAEYMYVVDDIMLVLDEHNIDEESKKDVLAILWSLKGMIIGQ